MLNYAFVGLITMLCAMLMLHYLLMYSLCNLLSSLVFSNNGKHTYTQCHGVNVLSLVLHTSEITLGSISVCRQNIMICTICYHKQYSKGNPRPHDIDSAGI